MSSCRWFFSEDKKDVGAVPRCHSNLLYSSITNLSAEVKSPPEIPQEAISPRQQIPIRRYDTLFGFLTSMGIHLAGLILLTVLGLVPRSVEPLELTFSVSASRSDSPMESLELEAIPMELPIATTEASPLPEVARTGLPTEDPTLEEFDKRAGKASGAESKGQGSGTDTSVAAKPERRQGSFFGTQAYGDEFVYVVDASRSMLSPCGFQYGRTRFEVASAELLRSLESLDEDQEFCVFFFGLHTRVMFDQRPKLIKATKKNRDRFKQWMTTLLPGEGTDPRRGVWQALKLKPSAIFLLSDGEFNGRQHNQQQIPGNPKVERIIQRYLHQSVPIHTIAFEDLINRRRLRNIATLTAGTHRFIGSQNNQQILMLDLQSSLGDDLRYALHSIIDQPSQLGHDRYLQPASLRLTQLTQFRNSECRELAHQAMLALADYLEVDASEVAVVETLDDKSDANFAQAAWVRIWREYFRMRDAETQLTRIVRP